MDRIIFPFAVRIIKNGKTSKLVARMTVWIFSCPVLHSTSGSDTATANNQTPTRVTNLTFFFEDRLRAAANGIQIACQRSTLKTAIENTATA
jgi:hypothetical protein